jgi:hypothetical protein
MAGNRLVLNARADEEIQSAELAALEEIDFHVEPHAAIITLSK